MKYIADYLNRLLFPPKCVLCRRVLEEDETGIRLTRRGVDISNFVFEKFLF